MPAIDDEAEFELLDSIFAEIDEATLSGLTRGKAATTKTSNNNTSAASTARQTPIQSASKAAPLQPKREPLGPVRNNSLSVIQTPGKSTQPRPILGQTSTRPFSFSTSQKSTPKHASLPFTRTVSRPLQQSTPPVHVRQAVKAPVKHKAEDDLLDGIDWSDEEAPSQATISQKSKTRDKGKGKQNTKQEQEALALSKLRAEPNYVPFSKRFTRCVVLSVTEKVVKDFRREKTIILEDARSKECRRVLLFDEWATTEVEIGDIVNVIGKWIIKQGASPNASTSAGSSQDDLPTCTMSYSSNNMLIVHPDTLISATRASDAHFCRRKAVLQEKVRSSSESTPALVYGNLLHELFQSCFLAMAESSDASLEEKVAEAFSLHRREAEVDRLLKVPKNIESLFTIHVELDEARNHLREKSITFAEFAKQYIGQYPKPDAFLSDPRSRNADPLSAPRLAISSVHDIEEDAWSPRLGLKGKIDASVQSSLTGPASPAWPLGQEHHLVMPFEIKTGRNTSVMQHRAQTMLYTQMMADRYDRTIDSGLLYYTQTNSLIRVEPVRNELRGLVIGRNDLARYLTPPSLGKAGASGLGTEGDESLGDMSVILPHASLEPIKTNDAEGHSRPPDTTEEDAMWGDIEEADLSGFGSQPPPVKAERALLPPAIDDITSCKKCYAADACTLYRRAVDKVKFIASDDDPLQHSYDDRVGHLTDAQSDFFQSWEKLISLEEREMLRFKKEIWTMSAQEREKHGRCFSNMIVDPYFSPERYRLKATSLYRYTYRMKRATTAMAHLPTQVVPYSQVLDNATQTDYASKPLTSGHMAVGDPVVVSMEPSVLALARGYILDLKADHVEIGLDHSLALLPGGVPASTNAIFRVDKDELQAGMGRIRENLAHVFYANGDNRRRALVVDLEKPRFKDPDYKALSAEERSSAKLNEDQLGAVDKVLKTQDYALILGMPGTGKTTTIAQMIKALTARGKSVLLTSYTHSAVDNILMKIKDMDINILRLGQTNKVMPAIAHLTHGSQEIPTSIAQLEQRLFAPQVVATTALGIDHPIFTRRRFDYCIVDEASQITLPTCLGPLRYAERFILVGDHKQLPPLVKNPMARKEGLEISLFRRLSEAHPESMVYLRHQYRMNADIMAISNRLVYDNTLVCGRPDLVDRSLEMIPPKGSWKNLCSGCINGREACWLQVIIDPKRHVVFVDTDTLPAREERLGRLVQNSKEAELVHQTAEAMLKSGVAEDQIGVITLYRQQIKLLQELLEERKGIEILTADKSQGRDKDCIIMSLTRSNTEKQVGDLIRDWRRLNVCFTRSRYKLIIFGSRTTLDETPHMQEFFSLVDERKWQYRIPAAARIQHSLEHATGDASLHKLKGMTATAPIIKSQVALAPPTPSSSPFTKMTVKRPANTAPAAAGPSIRASSPTCHNDDELPCPVIDLSFSSSPDNRPHKMRRKHTGSDSNLKMIANGNSNTNNKRTMLGKNSRILQDILNAQ